jgi:hypothetical protein
MTALILTGRILWVGGGSLSLWEISARPGAGPPPAIGIGRAGALARFGFGLLLGFGVLGLAYPGLALAGLFHPLALIAVYP